MRRTMATIATIAALVPVSVFAKASTFQKNTSPFIDHGVAAKVSDRRGGTAAKGAEGHDIMLTLLYSTGKTYALLHIDVETGEYEELPLPYVGENYGWFLSSNNKFCYALSGVFCVYDPLTKKFATYPAKTPFVSAFSFCEDLKGHIWTFTMAGTILRFDPKKRVLDEFGPASKVEATHIGGEMFYSTDGWIYGRERYRHGGGEVYAVNTENGEVKTLADTNLMLKKHMNGNIYAYDVKLKNSKWATTSRFILKNGKIKPIGKIPKGNIAGKRKQVWYEMGTAFPSGRTLKTINIPDGNLVVSNKDGTTKTIRFKTSGAGAALMGVAAVNGKIIAGTAMPMRYVEFNPKNGKMFHTISPGGSQMNCFVTHCKTLYIGGYTGGRLYKMEMDKPITKYGTAVDKAKDDKGNPVLLGSTNNVNRPHALAITPDGKTIIMSGDKEMVRYDFKNRTLKRVKKADLQLEKQNVFSIIPVSNDEIICGSGGVGASLFRYNFKTNKIVWHYMFSQKPSYIFNIKRLPNGRIIGFFNKEEIFLFDPEKQQVLKRFNFISICGPADYQQGNRLLVQDKERLYLITRKGVARIDTDNCEIAKFVACPIKAEYNAAGGDIIDGRLYYALGHKIVSLDLNVLEGTKK